MYEPLNNELSKITIQDNALANSTSKILLAFEFKCIRCRCKTSDSVHPLNYYIYQWPRFLLRVNQIGDHQEHFDEVHHQGLKHDILSSGFTMYMRK